MSIRSRLRAILDVPDPQQLHQHHQHQQQQQQRSEQLLVEVRDATRDLQRTVDSLRIQTQQLLTIERSNWEQRDQVAALLPVFDRERVRAHVAAAVERATLVCDPFPYFVVEDWLPPSLYQALVKAIPAPVFFAEKPAHKQQLSVPPPIAPDYVRQVWEFVCGYVVNTCLRPLVVDRLSVPLDAYVQRICPASAGSWPSHVKINVSEGRLMLRRPGYSLEPHRDPRWGFITCLAYLARANDSEVYGTRMYRVRNDREAPDESAYYVDKSACELVTTVPFRANHLLVFLNSEGAHGASIPPDAPPDVERYMYQFRMGPTTPGIKWLLERMPEAQRAIWSGAKTAKAGYQ
jgi:hypothetical protein